MNEFVLQPVKIENEVIVQFTDTVLIDKSIFVKVPNGYKALAYLDEKLCFRIEASASKNILKEYGKEYLGKEMKIAFVLSKVMPQMLWGFGNIQVNNNRLKEAYRVGANGTYIIEITDVPKLISNFSSSKEITVDMLREKSISALKTIGIPILSSCFANTNVSVFEISSLVETIRKEMIKSLTNEIMFSNLGIKINSLTVEGIHVNDDDLELIRNRIND